MHGNKRGVHVMIDPALQDKVGGSSKMTELKVSPGQDSNCVQSRWGQKDGKLIEMKVSARIR